MKAPASASALALCLAASAARAQAPPPGVAPDREMVEVRVGRGDSCEAIAERLYGDRRYYFVVAEHLPGVQGVTRTECDRALVVDTRIVVPRRALPERSAAEARVTAVEREVDARPRSAEGWRRAEVGLELQEGGRVRTHVRSSAELTFQDDSRLVLREQTLVVVHAPTASAGARPRSRATLERGALRSRLAELEGGLRVETPSARAELEAGEAVVAVDRDETSRLSNHRGAPALVSAPDGRGRVKVHPGMGTRVGRGGLPSPPRLLPPSPQWEDEGPLLVVGVGGLPATVRARWEPVDGAAAYVVELSQAGEEGETAESHRAPGSARVLETRGLPPGSYGARVSAVDAEGFESAPSRPLGLVVAELAALPPPPPGPEEGPPALLAGTRLAVPPSLRCGLGEGGPEPSLALADPGEATIRCQDVSGRQADELRVRVVPVDVAVSGLEPGEPIRLQEGGRGEATLRLTAELPLPAGVLARPGPGLTIEERRPWSGGEVGLDLVGIAPGESFVDLVVDGGGGEPARLCRVAVVVEPLAEAAAPEPAPEPTEGEAPRRRWLSGPSLPAEPSALLLQRGTFGVRDETRPGSGAFLAFAWVGDRREGIEGPADRLVVSGGLRGAFLHERLRIDAAIHVADDEAVGGGLAAVSSRILDGRPLGLAVELGVFAPFGDEASGGPARLLPSVDGSYRIGDRVTLRTRQGGLFDLSSEGLRLWSSAYGLDVWAVSPLGAFAELLLAVGGGGGQDAVVAAAASLGLSLRFHIVSIAVSARWAFTGAGADLYGQVAVIGALRLAAAP